MRAVRYDGFGQRPYVAEVPLPRPAPGGVVIRVVAMMVVPGHCLAQASREFLQLYPTARILVADEQNFAKDKRALVSPSPAQLAALAQRVFRPVNRSISPWP